MWEFLGSEQGQVIILSVVGFIFGFIKRRESVKKWKLEVAIKALEVGVNDTYRAYVRAIKDAKADGKLTDDEKEHARELAIAKAMQIAKEVGLDLVKYYGKEYLPVIIEKIVQRNKTAGKLANGALRPFLNSPELSE